SCLAARVRHCAVRNDTADSMVAVSEETAVDYELTAKVAIEAFALGDTRCLSSLETCPLRLCRRQQPPAQAAGHSPARQIAATDPGATARCQHGCPWRQFRSLPADRF